MPHVKTKYLKYNIGGSMIYSSFLWFYGVSKFCTLGSSACDYQFLPFRLIPLHPLWLFKFPRLKSNPYLFFDTPPSLKRSRLMVSNAH